MKNTHLQHPEDSILTGDLSVLDWFEETDYVDMSVKIDDVLDHQYDGVVKVIDLYYDIENVTEQKNKADYNVINALNLTPMPVV